MLKGGDSIMTKIFSLFICFLMILSCQLILAEEVVEGEVVKVEETEGTAAEVITYPAKVVKEGAEVVIEGGKNVVTTVGGTAEGIVTGDVEKAVTTPVKGTAETITDAAAGTVTAPVDAAKTEEEEIHKEDLPQ